MPTGGNTDQAAAPKPEGQVGVHLVGAIREGFLGEVASEVNSEL